MKYLTSCLLGLVAIVQCFKMAVCRNYSTHMMAMAPSFIVSDSEYQRTGDMAGVVFAEMDNLQERVIDAVADSMLSFLERQGFDLEDPNHISHLISFVQTMHGEEPAQSKGAKFMNELKKMAQKAWHSTKDTAKETAKEILLNILREVLKEATREAIPYLEKINERAMRTLPLNLRVALSPIVYSMWRNFFEKAKVRLPAGFKIEDFVCNALEKGQCDAIIAKVKNTWAPAPEVTKVPEIDAIDFDTDEEPTRAPTPVRSTPRRTAVRSQPTKLVEGLDFSDVSI